MVGGTWKDSPRVLSEVKADHMNGPIITTAPRASMRCVASLVKAGSLRFRVPASGEIALLIMDPPPLQPELGERDQDDDDEQRQHHGRALPLLVDHEGVLVEEVDERLRLIYDGAGTRAPPAGYHHKDQVEHLQRVDERDDGDEEHRRREQGQRD